MEGEQSGGDGRKVREERRRRTGREKKGSGKDSIVHNKLSVTIGKGGVKGQVMLCTIKHYRGALKSWINAVYHQSPLGGTKELVICVVHPNCQ